LERSLNHAVPDRRNTEDADLSALVFRDFLPPIPQRPICARDQFVPNLRKEHVHSARFDGREGHPVNTRGAIVLLGQRIGFAERVHLADVNVQAPETPGRFGLRLDVDPPPQVLQIDGCLYHLTPASRLARGIANSRVPSLGRHYSASTLLRTHPPPS